MQSKVFIEVNTSGFWGKRDGKMRDGKKISFMNHHLINSQSFATSSFPASKHFESNYQAMQIPSDHPQLHGNQINANYQLLKVTGTLWSCSASLAAESELNRDC